MLKSFVFQFYTTKGSFYPCRTYVNFELDGMMSLILNVQNNRWSYTNFGGNFTIFLRSVTGHWTYLSKVRFTLRQRTADQNCTMLSRPRHRNSEKHSVCSRKPVEVCHDWLELILVWYFIQNYTIAD